MRGRVREAFDGGPTLPGTLVSCSILHVLLPDAPTSR
jgi:hypothetical protein